MKDRIREIMDKEQMTQKDFAEALGISQASLSSVLTGRTNPTNNHVKAIHNLFPNINTNWLVFGEGDMYEDGEHERSSKEVETIAGDHLTAEVARQEVVREMQTQPQTLPPATPAKIYIERPPRQITEIRIFFDDGTYETFSQPKQ